MTALYSDLNQYREVPGDLVFDVASVYQHINNLLATKKRERLFNPEVGTDIEQYIFEPVDDVTSLGLYAVIVDAIRRWEPRVTVLSALSRVKPDPDNNRYDVELVFTIKGLTEEYQYSGQLLARYQQGT